jgi:hypothetical protein
MMEDNKIAADKEALTKAGMNAGLAFRVAELTHPGCYFLDNPTSSLSRHLASAFMWGDTLEGMGYWMGVCDALRK